ncbi:MAG TPA: 4a-hydroxytetrahydrobiopterin dehydratase [Actinomycetota bacterium]
MSKLFDDEVRLALKDLPDWRFFGNALHKQFRFRGFRAAMAFVNRVADEASTAGHHPDIEIHVDRVMLSLSTHDDGGVSAKDIKLAQAIERVIQPADEPSTAG